MRASEAEGIRGGTAEENAAIVSRVLDGEDGPARDVVVLNAGAAVVVGGAATDLPDGAERAREAIDSGAARQVLDRLVELTGELAGSPADS
jgi:anthranilate phosphoribosyltransferase